MELLSCEPCAEGWECEEEDVDELGVGDDGHGSAGSLHLPTLISLSPN